MIQSGETYDQWHRREFPNQYVWENYDYPDIGVCEGKMASKISVYIFACKNCQLTIEGINLTENHKKTIDYVLQNQTLLIDDIRENVLKYYRFLWNDYLSDDPNFPNPNSSDLKFIDKLIKLKGIWFAEKINEGYFGLCFTCDFEMEHGLGLRFRNYKVEEVGGEDIGFSLYPDE